MKLIAFMVLTALCFAQERVQPSRMAQLKMLVGEWRVAGKGGQVEFHYDMTVGMVGRARADGSAEWHRMMTIYPKGTDVLADFYSANGRVTHYRLDVADRWTLRFVETSETGQQRRQIVYEKQDLVRLRYRFETGGKVVDSGTLVQGVEIRPLSE